MYMNYRKKGEGNNWNYGTKNRWVNIYGEEKGRYCSNVIYSSKEEALNISKQSEEHITTIKIEWEE